MGAKNTPTKIEAKLADLALKDQEKSDLNDVLSKLNSFQNYLKELCIHIHKGNLRKGFVFNWTFMNDFNIQEKDFRNFCLANLISASESLQRIIVKLGEIGLNEVNARMLEDFICDLKPFINKFDKDQDYSWLLFNTNSHMTNFYHDLATNLFWHGKPGTHKEEHLVVATSTPFIIRQSIEYKIRRILGVSYIHINNKLHKTSPDIYFKTLRSNRKYYTIHNFDFELIEKIHSWTHLYVHGGYRAEPWRTEVALNYLENFFYSGVTSQKQSLSRYAAVEVYESDLKELKENTEKSIKKEIGDNCSIIWRQAPELAIIKEKPKIH
jgi:hypothetical protein